METVTKIITAIKAGKNLAIQRVNIYLNGKFAFSLDSEVVLKEQLKVGQPLSRQQLERLNSSDNDLRCLNAAYQFLSPRPRSRSEIEERLAKRGFTEPEIAGTLAKLERLHLVDDTAFAEYWKENRTAFRPRSRRMLKVELQKKGVDSAVISEAVSGVDENSGAYQAASVRARRLAATDYADFYRKLSGFLLRRGFGYGVVKSTVNKIWQEKTGKTDSVIGIEE